MPDIGSTPERKIEGKDWNVEVQTPSDKRQEIRQKFYEERAKLKMKVSSVKDVLDDLPKHGYKTLKELEELPELTGQVPSDEGKWLYGILKKYFRERAGIQDEKQVVRETFLTLHYLSSCGRNVDLFEKGETIDIKQGRMYVKRADGSIRIDGAFLRPPTKPTEPQPAPLPGEGPRRTLEETSPQEGKFPGEGPRQTLDAPLPPEETKFPGEGPRRTLEDSPSTKFPGEGPARTLDAPPHAPPPSTEGEKLEPKGD